MIKSKTITHEGLNVTMNIDVGSLKEKLLGPYRYALKVLKSMVLKRERYIKKLHRTLRKRDNIIFNIYASNRIYATSSVDLSTKRLVILSYLYNTDYAKLERIRADLKVAGTGVYVKQLDLNFLVNKGLILKAEDSRYYYISDIGKKKIDYVCELWKSSMHYFLKNKANKGTTIFKVAEKDKRPRRIFTTEQKEQKSIWYRTMMQPFWESNIKSIPRDLNKRRDVLIAWMDNKKMRGEPIDKLHYEYLQKWSK